MTRPARAIKPDGYLLGSYRIAAAPEPNSCRLTSFKSTCFDSPANNVGPWPASLGCTTNSYSFCDFQNYVSQCFLIDC
jgi:hypothetical protein